MSKLLLNLALKLFYVSWLMMNLDKEVSNGVHWAKCIEAKALSLSMSQFLMINLICMLTNFSKELLDWMSLRWSIKAKKCLFIAEQVSQDRQHSWLCTWLYSSKTKDGEVLRTFTITLKKSIDGKMLTKRLLSPSLRADKEENSNKGNINSGSKNKTDWKKKKMALPLMKKLNF